MRARVGISDFAQAELGDIAYVELPETGRRLSRGDVACTLESLKSSSEVYTPVSAASWWRPIRSSHRRRTAPW